MNMIKYILGAYGLCNILSGTSAMNIPHSISYVTDTTPQVCVVHNLKTKQISLDGITSHSLQIAAGQYNGIPLYRQLYLDGDMNSDKITSALKKSFGQSIQITILEH